jgi:hypothetical protein
MRSASSYAAILMMFAGPLGVGCRPSVVTTPVPAQMQEDHCWWAVLRSALPPDTVAIRFQRAFTAVGLTDATWTRSADTAWARAGPTLLSGRYAGATYASRAVAYRRGDSTLFRHYVAIALPTDRQMPRPDTVNMGARQISFCGEIARAAAIPTSVPRSPTGEETLTVWTRRAGRSLP